MGITINSKQFVVGIPENPDRPFRKPEWARRYRIRFRNNGFAMVFLTTASGISQRPLIDCGDHFEAAEDEFEQGRNVR